MEKEHSNYLQKKYMEALKERDKINSIAKGTGITSIVAGTAQIASVATELIALAIADGSIAITGITAAGTATAATVGAAASVIGWVLVPVCLGLSIASFVISHKRKKNAIEVITPIFLKLMLSIIIEKKENVSEKFKELETLIRINASHIKPISKFDMDNLIQKSIQEDLPKLQKKANEARFNIMILGKSGVGKSTLINAVLKKDVAKTGAGHQMTRVLSYYENSFLRLYDSRGIQISGYTLKESSDEILATIEKLSHREIDKNIHAIWYCFKGKRFEKEEVEYCKNLLNAYTDKKLPIFIVETNSISEDDSEEMEKIIRNDLGYRKITYVPVMAKELKTRRGATIPAFGVDELVNETLKKAEEAVDSSFYNKVKSLISRVFLERTIVKGINESEGLVSKETLEVIKNEVKQKEIFTRYQKVFKSIIENYYINGKEPLDSSVKNQRELDDIFKTINIWNEQKFKEAFDSFKSYQLEQTLSETMNILKNTNSVNFKKEKDLKNFMEFVDNQIVKPIRKNNSTTFYSILFYILAYSFSEGIALSAIETFNNSTLNIIDSYIKHTVIDYIQNIKTKYNKNK